MTVELIIEVPDAKQVQGIGAEDLRVSAPLLIFHGLEMVSADHSGIPPPFMRAEAFSLSRPARSRTSGRTISGLFQNIDHSVAGTSENIRPAKGRSSFRDDVHRL